MDTKIPFEKSYFVWRNSFGLGDPVHQLEPLQANHSLHTSLDNLLLENFSIRSIKLQPMGSWTLRIFRNTFFSQACDPTPSFFNQTTRMRSNTPVFFVVLEGFWGQSQGPNCPSPRATTPRLLHSSTHNLSYIYICVCVCVFFVGQWGVVDKITDLFTQEILSRVWFPPPPWWQLVMSSCFGKKGLKAAGKKTVY